MAVVRTIVAAAAAIIAVTLASPASAAGDPHVPDGAAGWCPGGQGAGYGGQRYCNGEPFGDGTFYNQMGHFSATLQWGWSSPMCSRLLPGNPTPQGTPNGCDGRGAFL